MHLGRIREREPDHPYVAFVKNITALRRLSGVTATAVEMDRYLWLRGAFEQWRKTPDGQMNVELKEFFIKHAKGPQLGVLVGDRR